LRNRNGFSLVELLAVIAILGILMGLAIGAYSRYKEKAIKESLDTMSKSAAEAADEYFMDHRVKSSVTFEVLVSEEYLPPPVDPRNANKVCSGKVEKQTPTGGEDGKLEIVPLKVTVNCSNFTSCMIYPDKTKC